MEIFWQKTRNPIRLVNHVDLAPSGYTPQVIVSEVMSNECRGSFPVERIKGFTWEDLLTNDAIPLATHIDIGLVSLRQIQEIDKRFGLVLLDRNPQNIIVEIDGEGRLHQVTQVDLVYIYDRRYRGLREKYFDGQIGIDYNYSLSCDPSEKSCTRILKNVRNAALLRRGWEVKSGRLVDFIDMRFSDFYICFRDAEQILLEARKQT